MKEEFNSTEEKMDVGQEVIVTQEVLDENPELAEAGLEVGDVGVVVDADTISFKENCTNCDNSGKSCIECGTGSVVE